TRTARSSTRTRSRRGSTIRASARSTRRCGTPAGRSTWPPRTRRRSRRSSGSRRRRASSRRSSPPTRSRARPTSTRSWSWCASPAAATRISRRRSPTCERGGIARPAPTPPPWVGEGPLSLAIEPIAEKRTRLCRFRVNSASAGLVKALVIYLMAGPDTAELAHAAVSGGADVVELGFPFSDPLADGPVIRRAAERALARGMRTRPCLECLAETRARVGSETPLVPMTYASLLEAYGWNRFEQDARAAGATSMIVADLPAGERPELRRVQLVAPTSTDERLRVAAAETDGWLYLVTLTGTTGARDDLSPALAGLVERARRLAPGTPLYAGFGISTPDHARSAGALADGIVVGSRALQVAEDGPAALERYVGSLRSALDAL